MYRKTLKKLIAFVIFFTGNFFSLDLRVFDVYNTACRVPGTFFVQDD